MQVWNLTIALTLLRLSNHTTQSTVQPERQESDWLRAQVPSRTYRGESDDCFDWFGWWNGHDLHLHLRTKGGVPNFAVLRYTTAPLSRSLA